MPELCAQPLVGYRYWSRHSAGGIGPIVHFQNRVWPANGRMSSAVPSLDHPLAHKHCGVHAYYRPPAYWHTPCPRVAGAMVGWGWVVEHEAGFRAQHAQVIAFMEMPEAHLVREAADRYGVPVLPRDELRDYCRWWGEVRDEDIVTGRCKCEGVCTCEE